MFVAIKNNKNSNAWSICTFGKVLSTEDPWTTCLVPRVNPKTGQISVMKQRYETARLVEVKDAFFLFKLFEKLDKNSKTWKVAKILRKHDPAYLGDCLEDEYYSEAFDIVYELSYERFLVEEELLSIIICVFQSSFYGCVFRDNDKLKEASKEIYNEFCSSNNNSS